MQNHPHQASLTVMMCKKRNISDRNSFDSQHKFYVNINTPYTRGSQTPARRACQSGPKLDETLLFISLFNHFYVTLAPLHKICVWTQIRKIKRNLIFNQSESRIKDLRFIFYASVPKVPEALCFRVVRPDVRPDFRPDLRPDFFVYAITQVLLDGISSNLVQGCTTRSRWTD